MTMDNMRPPEADIDRAVLAREAGLCPTRPWVILNYDTRRFPFASVLCRDVFKAQRLDRLHVYLKRHRKKHGDSTRLDYSDNLLLRDMMQGQPQEAEFWKLYHLFMLQVLTPWVGRALSYTSHPKMRTHLVGTKSVSSFHHDICVTRRIDQINFWMPFTDVSGGSALWLESDYGKKDYQPIPVRNGQVLIFDGGYLGHGSVFNDSETTRVSLDMRFSYKRAATRAEGVALMNRMIHVLNQSDSAWHV
jgi:hypothetical protein